MRSLAVANTDGEVRAWDSLCHAIVSDYFASGMDRDDLMQEARIGVVKALRDFDGTGSLGGFVALCARRNVQSAVTMANAQKHQALNESARVVHDEDGDPIEALLFVEDHGADVIDIVAARDRLHDAGRRVRERLTDIEYGVLLADACGYSYQEIAARLDVGEKTVDNALQRARRKLADDWSGYGRQHHAAGYRCPSCDGPTVKKPGRGRPPRCNVCRLSTAA